MIAGSNDVPVIVRVYVPMGVFVLVEIVSWEFAVPPAGGVTLPGEKLGDENEGSPVTWRLTCELNPPIEFTVTA